MGTWGVSSVNVSLLRQQEGPCHRNTHIAAKAHACLTSPFGPRAGIGLSMVKDRPLQLTIDNGKKRKVCYPFGSGTRDGVPEDEIQEKLEKLWKEKHITCLEVRHKKMKLSKASFHEKSHNLYKDKLHGVEHNVVKVACTSCGKKLSTARNSSLHHDCVFAAWMNKMHQLEEEVASWRRKYEQVEREVLLDVRVLEPFNADELSVIMASPFATDNDYATATWPADAEPVQPDAEVRPSAAGRPAEENEEVQELNDIPFGAMMTDIAAMNNEYLK